MNSKTLLLRQVHPSFVNQGRVTSQAFRPTPKDQLKLSVYNRDMIAPDALFQHYTEELQYKSSGVMDVTHTDFVVHKLSITPAPERFPEQVLIDFTGLSKSQVENTAIVLRDKAQARNWLFTPLHKNES